MDDVANSIFHFQFPFEPAGPSQAPRAQNGEEILPLWESHRIGCLFPVTLRPNFVSQATGMFDAIDTSKDRHPLEYSYRFFFMTNSDAEDGSNMDNTADDLFSTGSYLYRLFLIGCLVCYCVSGSFGTVEQFW